MVVGWVLGIGVFAIVAWILSEFGGRFATGTTQAAVGIAQPIAILGSTFYWFVDLMRAIVGFAMNPLQWLSGLGDMPEFPGIPVIGTQFGLSWAGNSPAPFRYAGMDYKYDYYKGRKVLPKGYDV